MQGLNELNAQYEQQYGPGDYIPNVFIQYWSMRVMAYLGLAGAAARAVGCLLLWREAAASRRASSCGSPPGRSSRRS